MLAAKSARMCPSRRTGSASAPAEGEVVDLGTDFAVDVSNGQSEVHVLSGEVEWHPGKLDMRRMQKGDAGRWSANGKVADLQANATSFVGPSELQEQIESDRRARLAAWQESSDALRKRPETRRLLPDGDHRGWESTAAQSSHRDPFGRG